VGVAVLVGVGVSVGVAVAVGVSVGVGVLVGVLVGVGVGVGVGARMKVVAAAALFVLSLSGTRLSGSAVAVLVSVESTVTMMYPSMVTVAKAAGPVPMEPRSQSRVPPVVPPTMTQAPRVVEKAV
jgi:hypothetical protein